MAVLDGDIKSEGNLDWRAAQVVLLSILSFDSPSVRDISAKTAELHFISS